MDPTVGEALRVLGYDRDFAALPPTGRPLVRVAAVPGWREVWLDRRRHLIRIPPGVSLDLGATAKGLAADRAANAAASAAGCGVLVSLGGDIAVAGDPPDDGWSVRVADWHAAGPEAEGETVLVASGGVATSSTVLTPSSGSRANWSLKARSGLREKPDSTPRRGRRHRCAPIS